MSDWLEPRSRKMPLFTRYKFKRISKELSSHCISKSASISAAVLTESEYASQVMKKSKNGYVFWEGVAAVIAYGIHMVDHYARNYLELEPRKKLVEKLIEQLKYKLMFSIANISAENEESLSSSELRKSVENISKNVDYVINKMESRLV